MTPDSRTDGEAQRFQVLPALAKLFLKDLQTFGRMAAVLPRKPTVAEMSAYGQPRVRLLGLILEALEHFGDNRLEQWRLPYCYFRYEWPPEASIAGYTGGQAPLDSTSLIRSILSNWHLELEENLNFRLLPAALFMTHQHGFAAAVDYLLDLLEQGLVVRAQSVAEALVSLVHACAGEGTDSERVIRFLGKRPKSPAGWMNASEKLWSFRRAADDPEVVQQLLLRLIARCLARVRIVRRAASWDAWLLGQAMLAALAETTLRTCEAIAPDPPLGLRAVLSQLEEMKADARALFLISRPPFRPFDAVFTSARAFDAMFRHNFGEMGRERLLTERLLVPARIVSTVLDENEELPLPGAWQEVSWRCVHAFAAVSHVSQNLFLARRVPVDPEPLLRDESLQELFGRHGITDRAAQRRIVVDEITNRYPGEVPLDREELEKHLQEALDRLHSREIKAQFLGSEPDSPRDELERVVGRIESLLALYPWNWLLHQELGIAWDRLDQPRRAVRCLVAAIFLAPEEAMPWQSLGVVLKRAGLAADAAVARLVQSYIEEGGLRQEHSTD